MIGKLGIIELRNIIGAIQKEYNIDFNDYAMTSFKRRLEKVMKLNSLNTAEEMIEKITEDKHFKEIFLKDLSVEDTEMFRDPYLWRYIREEIIPKLLNDQGTRIWFPSITSAEELYTQLIILKEENLLQDIRIVATSISEKNIECAKKGIYELKKMEINIANYKRYKGKTQLNDYFEIREGKAYMDTTLLQNVEFIRQDLINDKPPSRIKLVIFRNKAIYFNQTLQNKVLGLIYEALLPGGYLSLGVKETMDTAAFDKKFSIANKSENVFKKIVS